MALLRDSDGNNLTVVSNSLNSEKRLGVSAKISGGLTGLTGSIKWEKSTNDTNISTSGFTTFWNKNESGALYGFIFKTATDKMTLRIVIDNEIAFDIHLKDELNGEFSANDLSINVPPYIFEYSNRKYNFCPPEALLFEDSISLQLKTDQDNKNLEGYVVTWRSA